MSFLCFLGTIAHREKCGCKGIRRKVDVIQEILVKLSNTLKVDISEFDKNQQMSSDDDTLVGHIGEEEVQSNQKVSEWSEKNEDWNYQNISEVKMQGSNPEQQFWSTNKAAFNEGYQFEEESAIARRASDSFRRGSPRSRTSIDHDQSELSERRNFEFSRTSPRNRGGINIGESNRDEEFSSEFPRDSGLMPYRQARDVTGGHRSRAKRKQFRTETYQTRLKGEHKQPPPGTRKEMPSGQRVASPSKSPYKISPHGEVRRSESMPPRVRENYLAQRYPKESYYPGTGVRRNSPRNSNTDLSRRHAEERRRDRKEITTGRKRSPERFVIYLIIELCLYNN